MRSSQRPLTGITVGLTLARGVTVCRSSGGAQDEEGGGGNAAAGSVDTERYTVAMVAHAPAGDTFWDRVRTGAKTPPKP